MAFLAVLAAAPTTVSAHTHSDLSVSVVVTPPTFVAGGRNTIALTVRNAGPDAIDSGTDYSVSVYGEDHIITVQPPPYEVVESTIQGCLAERFVSEPLPDGNIALLFVYYFNSLPAGSSLTCTYEIEYYPSTASPLTLEWNVDTWYTGTNIDPDPSNNTLSYILAAAPPMPVTPVRATSLVASLSLGLGLLLTVGVVRGRRSCSTSGLRL